MEKSRYMDISSKDTINIEVIMSKKRILHVKYILAYDGASIIEYRLAQLLNDEFIFDWFLLSDQKGCYEDRFEAIESKIYHCPAMKKEFGTNSEIATFFRFLKEYQYDTVYFDTDSPCRAILACVARLAGVKHCIMHSHASHSEKKANTILNFIYRKLMFFSVTDCVACSKPAAAWLFSKKKAKTAIIITNGIDTHQFVYNSESRKTVRAFLNIPDSSCVIGHVGRFSEVKNHSKLIGIFNEFHKIHSESFLILIGDGELKDKIERFVSELKLSEYVKFIGNIDNVETYLSAMDALVLPSLFEWLPLTAVEAECSGSNVYISDGVPDEAILTRNTKKIPLSLSDKEWAMQIVEDLKQSNINRSDAAEIVRSKGYDIKDSAETLFNLLRGVKSN